MRDIVQLFVWIVIALILIWSGYSLYYRIAEKRTPASRKTRKTGEPAVETGSPGDPKVCPVCAARLNGGERVKSAAFPGMPGQGRLMHIYGCRYCLDGSRRRRCPVCGADLETGQILVARIFEKPGRSHVHVLGCSHCREALAGSLV